MRVTAPAGRARRDDVGELFDGVEDDLGLTRGELAFHVTNFVVQTDLGEAVVGALAGDELFNETAQGFGSQFGRVDVDEALFGVHGVEG